MPGVHRSCPWRSGRSRPGCGPHAAHRELGKHRWTAQHPAVAQLSDTGDRPSLTANDRGGPMLRDPRTATFLTSTNLRRSVRFTPARLSSGDPLGHVEGTASGRLPDQAVDGEDDEEHDHDLPRHGSPTRRRPVVPARERTIRTRCKSRGEYGISTDNTVVILGALASIYAGRTIPRLSRRS
jgi:hypothetical protein